MAVQCPNGKAPVAVTPLVSSTGVYGRGGVQKLPIPNVAAPLAVVVVTASTVVLT